jgi:hypothetical protein
MTQHIARNYSVFIITGIILITRSCAVPDVKHHGTPIVTLVPVSIIQHIISISIRVVCATIVTIILAERGYITAHVLSGSISAKNKQCDNNDC